MNITIRQALKSDIPTIVRFNALLASETENRFLDEQRLTRGIEALFDDPSKGLYYLAEVNNAVVGQTMITFEWSDWRNGTFWWIQSVYVEKAARGTGVFRALFNHIHSLVTAHGDSCGLRLYVERNNNRAKQTYSRLGMKYSHYDLYEMDFVL